MAHLGVPPVCPVLLVTLVVAVDAHAALDPAEATSRRHSTASEIGPVTARRRHRSRRGLRRRDRGLGGLWRFLVRLLDADADAADADHDDDQGHPIAG